MLYSALLELPARRRFTGRAIAGLFLACWLVLPGASAETWDGRPPPSHRDITVGDLRFRFPREYVTAYSHQTGVFLGANVADMRPFDYAAAPKFPDPRNFLYAGVTIALSSDETSALPRANDGGGAAAWLRGFLPLYAGQWDGK